MGADQITIKIAEPGDTWLLLHPDLRGGGTGRGLVRRAVEYAHGCGYESIFLTTVPELTAAAHLYLEAGFAKVREHPTRPWGGPGVVQVHALALATRRDFSSSTDIFAKSAQV